MRQKKEGPLFPALDLKTDKGKRSQSDLGVPSKRETSSSKTKAPVGKGGSRGSKRKEKSVLLRPWKERKGSTWGREPS